MTLTVALPGVTGRLGGPVADLLLERGHRIRALVRDPAAPAAASLHARGAAIVQGDFDDAASLRGWLDGADVALVFSTPHHGIGTVAETRHAVAQIDAAREAGVGAIVYSSSAGADRPTRVPFMESKRVVEQHLRSLPVPSAVVAPVYCMDNVRFPWNLEPLRAGRVVRGLPPDRALQQVAMADLAAFCAIAIERHDAFAGTRWEIASDVITGQEEAQALTRALGRPVAYVGVPPAQAGGMAPFFEFLAGEGFAADIKRLRADYPEVGWRTFETWARAQDWESLLGTTPVR
ncbi:MAG TPA: NmrA family NAD(P)-binding protein [Candidatus Dormibacteraeota bacterium]|nr:NmrA family NAD(P)-binding protein [Candidatus Dormibacteraeota bacterium]